MNRATRRQLKVLMERKAARGLLPPQRCERCRADLRDHDVPPEYAHAAAQFGTALEVLKTDGTKVWVCPHCGHEWLPH